MAMKALTAIRRWFDSSDAPSNQGAAIASELPHEKVDMLRCIPFIILHLACFCVIWVGWSPVAVGVCIAFYLFRVFAVTAFYHRYFSHRSFRTSRPFQFLMGVAGSTAVQRGPLWWSAHHRHHHLHSDENPDHHSPGLRGFWMSHMGWFMTDSAFPIKSRMVRDWGRYPELLWLDRFDWVVPAVTAVSMFGLGVLLESFWPASGTTGWQMFIWGFVISTIALYHVTYTINSLAHKFGSQRFETGDDSRNNFLLALLTFGEGWHNNHHHYPSAARQGFYWWELDITYLVLRALSFTGLIWNLRPVPTRVLEEGRRRTGVPVATSS